MLKKFKEWFTTKVEWCDEGEKGPLVTRELLKYSVVALITYLTSGWFLLPLLVAATGGALLTRHYFGDKE